MSFDHEKLDVYRVALQFAAWTFGLCEPLAGAHRHTRDQLLRASQSIVENVAEGNGKRSAAERRRFFDIARGSAMESAAELDILVVCRACTDDRVREGKGLLERVVAMLSKMTEPPPVAREEPAEYLPR